VLSQDGYVPEVVAGSPVGGDASRRAEEPHGRPAGGLPGVPGGFPPARRWGGLGLAAAGLPALTATLVLWRDTLSLGAILLLYLLAVVIVAGVGGILAAVLAAVASFVLANWFLTPPYHTLRVEERDSIIELAVFVVVALIVSIAVEAAARRRVAAARSRVEAEMLSRFTAEPVSEATLPGVLERVRTLFGMTSVALLQDRGDHEEVAAIVGPEIAGPATLSVSLGGDLRLVATGPEPFGEDRRFLASLAETAARAWEGQQLAQQAAQTRELAEIDRVRAALLAAVGHDLRTPLAGIKVGVSSLRQPDVAWTPEEQSELLATIEASADRLDALIGNLLAMSRLQAGALSVSLQPVALDAVVAQALIDTDAADVEVHVPDDLPAVTADPGLLERVVANLVDNARKFNPRERPVRVEAGNAGGRPDMPAGGRPRARRAGARVAADVHAVPTAGRPRRQSGRGPGTGDRPRIHGGHARQPGALPHAGRGPHHDRHHAQGMTTILIVEDEPQLRQALGINLRARRYEVHAVADGGSALRAAGAAPFDLVILDLGLPDMDGVEVVRGLRGWSTVPIIVLSARDTQAAKVAALDAGADDYVTKPFGMEELLARIRAALRRAVPRGDTPVVRSASFTVDLGARRTERNGEEVRLTPTEWHLLEILVRNPGKLVTHRQLLKQVWGPAYVTETNYLRVYMAQLRRKLEPDPSRPRHLLTEAGVGYRFQP
jgi:two-component system, OmpR family, sensor histidine kinase KdpD